MLRRWLILLVTMAAVLLPACAPQTRYTQLEGALRDQRRSEIRAIERLEAEVDRRRQAEQELAALQQAMAGLQQEAAACRSQITALEARSAAAEEKSLQLVAQLTVLKLEIEKRKSIIELQNKVIKLLDDAKETIETSLKEQLEAQNIKLEDFDGRLKMIFVDKILFDSGSTEIQKEGKKLLLKIAETLKLQQEQFIVIEGHTDNVPISPAARKKFPSNWELSTARASAVACFLAEEAGLDPRRLAATGYSAYRPVASNDTTDGRRQNRRIEIVLDPLH